MTNRTGCIGIDWGSTHARAFLLDEDGGVVEQHNYPYGIKRIEAGGHRARFLEMVQPWRARDASRPVFLSGMIGSRHGWQETPYVPCPAPLAALVDALVPLAGERDVFIVPGLSMTGARPDVMRGEELQLLGVPASPTEQCVCIPGTHAKWIVTSNRTVREFHTAMTGEVFEAVIRHTLFNQLLPTDAARGTWREVAFRDGLARSASPHGLLHALFELRAAWLLTKVAADDLPDLLSGLLIGTELRHAQTMARANSRVLVIAASDLAPRYACALRAFEFEPEVLNADETTARGFATLAGEFFRRRGAVHVSGLRSSPPGTA